MKNEIYLGNGCLSAEINEKTISFFNSTITTSQVVNIQEYKVFSNPNGLGVNLSEEITHPHYGGGDETTNTVSVELKPKTSFVMMCNAQNQIDSYIKFVVSELGNLSFEVIAEQYYYKNEFQGQIDKKDCTEKELQDFLSSLSLLEMPRWFQEAYKQGQDVKSILSKKGIEPRNKTIQKEIDTLFLALDKSNKDEAKGLLASLEKKLGCDDLVIIQAKMELKYSEFYTLVDNNSKKATILLEEIGREFGENHEFVRASSYLEIFND